ncbi:MAG: zinc transporter substrate-binding protein [Cyanobium sp. CACIAM 14]|nr:MAG: zinc transporter substrate-binding protein [Cyanobium sp. CACIAM 14]
MRRVRSALALVLCTGMLSACASTQAPRAPIDAPAGEPLRVVTTIFPITAFTTAVGGDCVTVTPLLPPGVGPHEFQASPGDLVKLRDATVLVRNGLGLEDFLDKLIANAGNPRLRVIEASAGLRTLASPDGGSGGHGHLGGPVNPHVWLDPRRAMQQVETIRAGLSQARPACRATFERNAAALTGQLKRLDADLERQLRPYAGRSFVAFHDFAPYFADRYGLEAEFLVEVPEQNPSPADLQRVSERVRASALKALLSEPQEGSRSFNALAADLGVTLSLFDPMETGPAAAPQTQGNQLAEHYIARMRRNVQRLLAAFGG